MRTIFIICILLASILLFSSSITARVLIQKEEEKSGHKHEDLASEGSSTVGETGKPINTTASGCNRGTIYGCLPTPPKKKPPSKPAPAGCGSGSIYGCLPSPPKKSPPKKKPPCGIYKGGRGCPPAP